MSTSTLELSVSPGRESAVEIGQWIAVEVARLLNEPLSVVDRSAPLMSLGIDSLGAIGITSGLAQWLQCDVPATLMWEHDSIDAVAGALAAELVAQKALPRMPLPIGVKRLREGKRPPLFLFPGLEGGPMTFAPLASHLHDIPVYGIDLDLTDAVKEPNSTMEQIAAVMCRCIRLMQPRGPYQLGGFSIGGLLAYETARQLRQSGECVSALIVFDTFAPNGTRPRPFYQRLLCHAWLLLTQKRRTIRLSQQMRNIWERFHQRKAVTEVVQDLATKTAIAFGHAAKNYQPKSDCGSIVVFRAMNRHPGSILFSFDPYHGWQPLARGGVRIIDIPGDHVAMVQATQAGRVAEKLLEILESIP